jgi:hypothetical protein
VSLLHVARSWDESRSRRQINYSTFSVDAYWYGNGWPYVLASGLVYVYVFIGDGGLTTTCWITFRTVHSTYFSASGYKWLRSS